MIKKMFPFFIVLVIFLNVPTALAAERHVGSGQTYSTIQAAVNAASCGDTIYIHSGTYNENIEIDNRQCTSGSRVTITPYGSDTVSVSYSSSSSPTFWIHGSTHYWTIDCKNQMTITGGSGVGNDGTLRIASSSGNIRGIEVKNCVLHGNAGSYGIVTLDGEDLCLIEGNTFEGSCYRGVEGQGSSTGPSSGDYRLIIRGNTFVNPNYAGPEASHHDYWLVEKNYIYGSGQYLMQIRQSNYWTVQNNVFEVKSGGVNAFVLIRGFWEGDPGSNNNKIIHNTFVSGGSSPSYAAVFLTDASNNNIIQNNLFIGSFGSGRYVDGASVYSGSGNQWLYNRKTSTSESWGDPGGFTFTGNQEGATSYQGSGNKPSPYFDLTASYDGSSSNNPPTDDYDGNSRSSPPDIGAFEYGGASLCGNDQCDSGECDTCPNDCTLTYCCGIEGCNPSMGEDCNTCSQDCPCTPPGVCCSGVCDTTTGNEDFHQDCRAGPACVGTSWEYSYANNGSLCGGYQCRECNNGYCSFDDDSNCGSAEACIGGACVSTGCTTDDDCSGSMICCDEQCTMPVCSQGSDCGSETCKIYTCSNPGTCLASCSSQDITSCINSDDCCPSGCTELNDDDCMAEDCSDLAMLYHFDNDPAYRETTSLVYDFSGNGNNATCSGSSCPSWTSSGNFLGAFDFDGSDDFFDVPAFTLGSQFTYSAWIRPLSSSGWVTILTNSGMSRWLGLSDMRMEWYDGGDENVFGSALSTNVWHHLAVTYDGSELIAYHNGNPVGSPYTASYSPITDSFMVGDDGYNEYFAGRIDEIAVWNRALTAGEIQNLYDSNAPMSCGGVQYHRADNNPQDGCIELSEIMAFIDNWKVNSTAYPMWEMMEAVVLWKSGTGC